MIHILDKFLDIVKNASMHVKSRVGKRPFASLYLHLRLLKWARLVMEGDIVYEV